MKRGDLFLYILVFGIFIVASIQVYNILFVSDKNFDSQIENHLISVVQIKGERINDYFSERKHDSLVLAESEEVKNLLGNELMYDSNIIEENMKQRLEIASEQMEIFLNKYPGMSLKDLQDDEDFRKIAIKKFGDKSRTLLVNSANNLVILDEKSENIGKKLSVMGGDADSYVKTTDLTTDDGTEIGVAYLVYSDEFKLIKNPMQSSVDYLRDFKNISDYYNIILINSDGYVVYELDKKPELGSNLKFNSEASDLGKTYSLVGESREEIIHGPYMQRTSGGFDLIFSFAAPVYEDGSFIGLLVLQSKMDSIYNIAKEKISLGESGEFYIVDERKFLITPSKESGHDIFVQTIETENSLKCFENKDREVSRRNLISYFTDFKGKDVVGTYSYIDETGWCLISEISSREIFESPKKGVYANVVFVLIINLILLIIGLIIGKKLNKKREK